MLSETIFSELNGAAAHHVLSFEKAKMSLRMN